MRRFALFLGWLVVVGIATTLTWQIVSAADDRVSERPIAPLNVAAPAIANDSTTTTASPGASTSLPGSSSTSSTSTTQAASGTTTSSVTTAPSSTTATAAWQTRTVQTAGGTVNLRYRPGEVAYQSATPAPGFQVEVEKPGPPEVRVEFESASAKVEVQVSWQGGALRVDLSTDGEDEHED